MDVFVDVLDRSDRGIYIAPIKENSMAGRTIQVKREKADDSPASDDVQLMMEEEPETLSLTLDVNGQYQFRADNGPGSITYRVVQVTQDEDGSAQLIGGLASNPAILQGLGNGDRLGDDSPLAEARLAYIPAAVTGIESRQGLDMANAATNSVSPSAGPFYVMMTPSDVLQSSQQRTIMPRLATAAKPERGARITRDDRRRATHNEVERRRRDKINCWILQLGKLVPDFNADQAKQGDSKSVILSKACDYIAELQNAHKELSDRLKDTEHFKNDLELLRRNCEELKHENDVLRAHMQERGISLEQLTDDLPL